ncbi:T-complex protein 11-domain-containing protein [Baffinella frigidus]|nr:T-complex protein 11-domain-containing protein [Cryptophyta sp. CCMP2293]
MPKRDTPTSVLPSMQEDRTSHVTEPDLVEPVQMQLGPRKRSRHWTPSEILQITHAIKMQRFRTYKLVVDGCNLGMTSAVAKTLPFAELSSQFRDTARIKAMKLILHRVCVLTAEGVRSCPGSEETKSVKVRVFLASFMIAYHPTSVFERITKLETDLQDASVKMLEVFDPLCLGILQSKRGSCIKEHVTKALTFPGVLHTYLKAFQAWKLPDEAKLTDRIKHALTALYQAEDHLVEDDHDTPRLRTEFVSQQVRLRTKLVQIAGQPALDRLDALRAAQGDIRTHASVKTEAGDGTGMSIADNSGYNALPRRMTNQQVAHELLIDPAFTLDEYGGCHGEAPVHSKIRKSFHDAFWASLSDDLRLDPPCYARVVRVLQEISDGISELWRGGKAFKGAMKIKDVLDMELIQQQVDKGCFSWTSCVKLMHDVMVVLAQFQHGSFKPETDISPDEPKETTWEDVQEVLESAALDVVKQPTAFCQSLEFLLDRTKAVRIEAANHYLNIISPMIKVHGIEYESTHFDRKLLSGEFTLTHTRTWLCANIRTLVEAEDIALDDLTTRDSAKSASYISVLNSSIMNMLTTAAPPDVVQFPELLLLDITRITGMRAAFRLSVLVSSILVIVGQKLSELRVSTPATLLEKVAQRIFVTAPRAKDLALVIAVVCEELEQVSEINGTGLECLQAVLMKGVEPSRPVPKLMEKRIRDVMLHGIDTTSVDNFASDSTTALAFKDFKLPLAVSAVAPELRKGILLIRKMIAVSTKVHSTTYNNLIAAESAGLITSRVPFIKGDTPTPGYRTMTVVEATNRLNELIKTGTIASTDLVRLNGGFIHRGELEWVVLETKEDMACTEALLVPISIDKIALGPGASPPDGFRLVTSAEVSSTRWAGLMEGWLQPWSVVRLKDGKLAGSGYNEGVTSGNFADASYIGEAFVTSV